MSTDTFAKTYKLLAGTGLSDVWWKTGRLTIKASRAETGGSLAQFETNDPRGTATPLHIHHKPRSPSRPPGACCPCRGDEN